MYMLRKVIDLKLGNYQLLFYAHLIPLYAILVKKGCFHLTLREIRRIRWSKEDRYPFNPEVVKNFDSLNLTAPVTIIAGDNGSGKTTLSRRNRGCGRKYFNKRRTYGNGSFFFPRI